MKRVHMSAGVALWLVVLTVTAADVTIGNHRLRLQLTAGGRVGYLVHIPEDRELTRAEGGPPLASIRVGGTEHPADQLRKIEGGIALGFHDIDTRVDYAVDVHDDWIRFRVIRISGTRPERMTLFQLHPTVNETLGRRLCIAYDDRTAVSLMAGNQQTRCIGRGDAEPVLRALSQDAPGPTLEGAAVGLIVCSTDEFKKIARAASHAFGLLTNEAADGTPVKDTDLVRGSYFFMSFGESEADKMIDLCRRAGIRQVMLNSGAWCKRVGHYVINERAYPDGLESLRRTVQRLHDAGILVGMHCFASKISKRDAYVTPVPDKRFWHKFEDVLAEEISTDATEIRVRGSLDRWPGCPTTADQYWEGGVSRHREVVIGEEIIQYESIGPEGIWNTFLGCRRGAWGTEAAAHPAGAPAVHYGVDGCINGYIIDQETDLLQEAHERLAHIFNTCGFDMVYFDGGEDVDRRRFHYYATKFQESAMRAFQPRPIVHMGTVMTHRLWHSFARSSTVDTYLNTLGGAIVGGRPPEKWPTVRDHIERSVSYMLSVKRDMMPGELGWFGIWGRRKFHGKLVDGLQLDELEYLMCRSLAHDAPVSLQTSFRSMEEHPLTPEILRIFRAYEDLRMSRQCAPADLVSLTEPGRDHVLLRLAGTPEFVPVEPVATIGGGRDIRGTVGAYKAGSLATLWHTTKWGTIALDIDAGRCRAIDFDGRERPVVRRDGRTVVTVDCTRTTLLCEGLPPEVLGRRLVAAATWTKPAEILVVQAEDASSLAGEIALGSTVGVHEPGAYGDVLVGTAPANYTEANNWYAEFAVMIPHDGVWYLWSRQRYPSGTDQSFAFVPEGEPITFSGHQVLGNCGRNNREWHWAGRGGGSTTVPPGQPIPLPLEEGVFRFRIHPRECGGTPGTNPRLDLVVLVDDPVLVPGDDLLETVKQTNDNPEKE